VSAPFPHPDPLPVLGVAPTARSSDVRDAALTLFAQWGYHGTSMKDLADAVGMRPASLYNHLRSKHELLRAVMLGTSRSVLDEFEAATADVDDLAERLWRATRVYVLRHARYRREALIVNRELSSLEEPVRSEVRALRRAHERALRAIIEEGREAGRFNVDSPVLASFAILEMGVSVARWFRPDGALTAEAVAEGYADFAVRIAGAARP
jgi:AcrR family transcriptional regulator